MADGRRLEQTTLMPPQPQPWRRHRPASLMDELIEEILLRLPRATLIHAALVCKPWHHLVSSPRFRRRFLEFQGTPPMLGFVCNYPHNGGSSFVSTPTSPLQLQSDASRWWSALDARHGRILLRPLRGEPTAAPVPVTVLVVWDPITSELRELPALPRPATDSCAAAILCCVTGCDHHCCHRGGPFRVVFVSTESGNMFISTYSSSSSAWSEPISIQRLKDRYNHNIYGGYSPSVLLKNELYFGIERTNAALRYDLELHEESWFQLPRLEYGSQSSVLITTDDGELGLVRVLDGVLCIWLRRNDMDTTEGNSGWTKFRVIHLKRHLHVRRPSTIRKAACVVGFADGLGIVFVTVNSALYTVDLETCMVVKRKKQVYNGGHIGTVFPYMHFYLPEPDAAS